MVIQIVKSFVFFNSTPSSFYQAHQSSQSARSTKTHKYTVPRPMMTTATPIPSEDTVRVEVIQTADDFPSVFHCLSEAFGHQARDAIWQAFNPGWDTPAGRAAGAARLAQRWETTKDKTDDKGNPCTVFLKATLPAPTPGHRVTAGFAIWEQATAVPGHGTLSLSDATSTMDLEPLYPGNLTEQRFLRQMSRSLFAPRLAYLQSKTSADPPCIMALDICATDPAFQRRGVASALVRWGLEEARRRGIPDLTTEASRMGRHVYARLGFVPQGPDLVYVLDEEFEGRETPPNVFMVCSQR